MGFRQSLCRFEAGRIVKNKDTCPVCSQPDTVDLITIEQAPVFCNILSPSREEALQVPKGDIRLAFCNTCGHVFNAAFDSKLLEYSQAYENSLHFSPRFQSYAESLAKEIIERHNLRGKDIIDIGCGQGDFLKLLCKLGDNRGVGFDRSYAPEQDDHPMPEQVSFVQDFYSADYADYPVDFICCRHVLEHIETPREFLDNISRIIEKRNNVSLFFEVPRVLYTLRDMGIWDIIYEHYSYFSANSMAHLFDACGFDISHLEETYQGQFLCIEAVASGEVTSANHATESLDNLSSLAGAFADNYRAKVKTWQHNLEQMAAAGQRVVVWGGGSKGVTFLNILQTQDKITYVVDINPRKEGMFVAGTGQQIVRPEFLQSYKPDIVIVMNPIYCDEISQDLKKLGVSAELMPV